MISSLINVHLLAIKIKKNNFFIHYFYLVIYSKSCEIMQNNFTTLFFNDVLWLLCFNCIIGLSEHNMVSRCYFNCSTVITRCANKRLLNWVWNKCIKSQLKQRLRNVSLIFIAIFSQSLIIYYKNCTKSDTNKKHYLLFVQWLYNILYNITEIYGDIKKSSVYMSKIQYNPKRRPSRDKRVKFFQSFLNRFFKPTFVCAKDH